MESVWTWKHEFGFLHETVHVMRSICEDVQDTRTGVEDAIITHHVMEKNLWLWIEFEFEVEFELKIRQWRWFVAKPYKRSSPLPRASKHACPSFGLNPSSHSMLHQRLRMPRRSKSSIWQTFDTFIRRTFHNTPTPWPLGPSEDWERLPTFLPLSNLFPTHKKLISMQESFWGMSKDEHAKVGFHYMYKNWKHFQLKV